jgi:glycosyltransferase involved in cell wall biosynthesis
MYSISVVLPAYNEEENISAMVTDVLTTIEPITSDFEIVVVDDGSRDRTAEIVRELSARFPPVRLVQHPTNQGYGAAVYTGFTSATKELVFFTDADNQFVLSEINRFLPCISQAELVVGYRAPRRDPWYRVLFGRGWSLLVTLLFGYTARDIDCAFKLFRREILDRVAVNSRGATFSAEFLVRSKRHGYKIAEVPVTHRPRLAGQPTGARLHVILRAFRELVRFRVGLWQEKNA